VRRRPHAAEEDESQAAEAEATWFQFTEEVVPRAAELLPEGRRSDFRRTVSEMLALAKQETTMEAVVVAQGRNPGREPRPRCISSTTVPENGSSRRSTTCGFWAD